MSTSRRSLRLGVGNEWGKQMQRGPHSRKQHGRYNPNAPDYNAVHRPRPAHSVFWTLPEGREPKPKSSGLGKRLRKWRCFGAGKLSVVRANTKSEARSRFKAMLGSANALPSRLPVGVVVMAA